MNRASTIILTSTIALVFLLVAHVLIGKVSIPVSEVFSILRGQKANEVHSFILLHSRIPTAICALLAGGALSVAGLYMQTLFRNPVAGPYILGITSGSSLVVAFFIMGASSLGISFSKISLLDNSVLVFASLIGSFFFSMIILWFSMKVRSVTTVLIIGLMLSSGASAIISLLESMANKSSLQTFTFWSFGSFAGINYLQLGIMAAIIVLALALSLSQLKGLNVYIGGEIYAQSLGINIKQLKIISIISTALLAGVVTSYCGPIGFVGLAVPHLSRYLMKTSNHIVLLPICFILGAIVCLLCSMIASLPFFDTQIPVNIITSLIGSPVMIYILWNQKNSMQHG